MTSVDLADGSAACQQRVVNPRRPCGAESVALRRRDRAGMMAAADSIDKIMEQPNDDAVWAQVTPLLSQIASLATQEQRRRVEMSGLMRTEKVAEFARELLMIVRTEVADPQAWNRVQDRVGAMVDAYSAVVDADQRAAERAEC